MQEGDTTRDLSVREPLAPIHRAGSHRCGQETGVVEEMVMIARMWRGWVRTEQANAYVAYITGTGLREYAATPGNLGCQMWTRDLGDGRTEVLTVSWWESRAAIIGFAGSDIEAAVFYPEDDEYLVDRETTVSHFEVAAAQAG